MGSAVIDLETRARRMAATMPRADSTADVSSDLEARAKRMAATMAVEPVRSPSNQEYEKPPSLMERAKKVGGELLGSAQTPIPVTLNRMLGTPQESNPMAQSGKALGHTIRQGLGEAATALVDIPFGKGTAAKIANYEPVNPALKHVKDAVDFGGELIEQGSEAAGGLVDFMASPLGIATAGAGIIPKAAVKASEVAFGAQMTGAAWEKIKKAIDDPTAHNLADALVGTVMAALPAVHGVSEHLNVGKDLKTEFKGDVTPEPPKPLEQQMSSGDLAKALKSEKDPAKLDKLKAEAKKRLQEHYKQASQSASVPPEKLSDAALQQTMQVETGPRRKELEAEAQKRGVPVVAPIPAAQAAAETFKPITDYDALFDQADKLEARRKREKPTIPTEGPSDEEQRQAAAREDVSSQLGNTVPYDQLEPEEKQVVDDFIAGGYIGVGAPERPPAAATEAPSVEPPKPRRSTKVYLDGQPSSLMSDIVSRSGRLDIGAETHGEGDAGHWEVGPTSEEFGPTFVPRKVNPAHLATQADNARNAKPRVETKAAELGTAPPERETKPVVSETKVVSGEPPAPRRNKKNQQARAKAENLKGKTVRNYFGELDQVLDVTFDGEIPIYTVKDLATGEVRNHSTPIKDSDVAVSAEPPAGRTSDVHRDPETLKRLGPSTAIDIQRDQEPPKRLTDMSESGQDASTVSRETSEVEPKEQSEYQKNYAAFSADAGSYEKGSRVKALTDKIAQHARTLGMKPEELQKELSDVYGWAPRDVDIAVGKAFKTSEVSAEPPPKRARKGSGGKVVVSRPTQEASVEPPAPRRSGWESQPAPDWWKKAHGSESITEPWDTVRDAYVKRTQTDPQFQQTMMDYAHDWADGTAEAGRDRRAMSESGPEASAEPPARSGSLLDKVQSMEPIKGVPVSTLRLRKEFPGLTKEEFDQQALRLRKEQKVFLSQYGDNVNNLSQADRDILIHDPATGEYFVAVAERTSDEAPGGDEPPETPDRNGDIPDDNRNVVGNPYKIKGSKIRKGNGSIDFGAYVSKINDGIREAWDRVRHPDKYTQHSSVKANVMDWMIRNLSELSEVAPDVHTDALRATGSKGQANILSVTVLPRIAKALEGSQISPDIFLAALEQDRLDGIKSGWGRLAADVRRLTPDEFMASAGAYQWFVDAIKDKSAFQGDTVAEAYLRGIGGRMTQLIENNKLEEARNLAAGAYELAAQKTGTIFGSKPAQLQYSKISVNDPHVAEALKIYKEGIEAPAAKAHKRNEGVFADWVGPKFGTWVPLSAPKETGIRRWLQIPASSPYKKGRNIANYFTTGLSKDYDLTWRGMLETLGAYNRNSNMNALKEAMVHFGIIQEVKPYKSAPAEIYYAGKMVPAVVIPLGVDRIQKSASGKLNFIPARKGVIPATIKNEIDILLKHYKDPATGMAAVAEGMAAVLTKGTLMGVTDAEFHSLNLLGGLIGNTPWLENSLFSKTVGGWFPIKALHAIYKLSNIDPLDPKWAKSLQELADLGLVPDKYGHETYSKKLAELTGAEKVTFSAGPLLFGPKGIDIRARLLMYEISKEVNPLATPQQHFRFVSQLGNYVRDNQSFVERGLKNVNLGTFATAGLTAFRNGVNAAFSTGPLPIRPEIERAANPPESYKGDPKRVIEMQKMTNEEWQSHAAMQRFKEKVRQQMTVGIVSMAATALIANYAVRQKWAWDDKAQRLGKVIAPDWLRQSTFGISYWGPDLNKLGYLDIRTFNPDMFRVSEITGVENFLNTLQKGGSVGMASEEAKRQFYNSAMAPVTRSPVVRFATVAAFGKEPYITQLRNRQTGAPEVTWMSASKTKQPGLSQEAENIREAFAGINPMGLQWSGAMGLGERGELEESYGGKAWVRNATGMVFPRFFALGENPDLETKKLKDLQKRIDATVKKEETPPELRTHGHANSAAPPAPRRSHHK